MKRLALALFLTLSAVLPVAGVQPSEVLDDPVLEERARRLSAGLRCMVCQNQSIDDSDAELARDLRVLVRERLVAGESDAEVIDYVVSRYGEFVLLQPRFNMRNMLLWAAPLVLLLAGAGVLALWARKGRQAPADALTPDEELRLRDVLKGTPDPE